MQTAADQKRRVRSHDLYAAVQKSKFVASSRRLTGRFAHTGPCGYEFYWSTGKPYGKFAAGGGGFFGGWMGGGGADY